jgi:hypothetical protein
MLHGFISCLEASFLQKSRKKIICFGRYSYYFSPIFSDCATLVAEIMGSFTDILQTSNRRFSKLTAKPFKFLQSGEELTEDFKLLAKVVYDLGKLSEKNSDAKEGGNE